MTLRSINIFLILIIATLRANAFSAREVAVENIADSVVLAGTLTLPDNGKPVAAIVMITGSGAQDRDETVFGHKLFKTIAEYLSNRGYAVLRTDDRGVGVSTGSGDDVTPQSNVRDAAAVLKWIAAEYPDIPAGFIGHSEGGQTAVRASVNPECRFIVTLACNAWKGDSLVMAQSRAISVSMTGLWEAESLQRQLLSVAESQLPAYSARMIMLSALASSVGEQARIPEVQEYMAGQVDAMLSPWYREFLRYDPADDIRAVSVPWLALNGSKDLQVPVENLVTISSLNPNVETKVIDGHNHLFQHATTGLPQEYATISGDISPETLAIIADWLDEIVVK